MKTYNSTDLRTKRKSNKRRLKSSEVPVSVPRYPPQDVINQLLPPDEEFIDYRTNRNDLIDWLAKVHFAMKNGHN